MIGDVIKKFRKFKDLTQSDMCEAVDITQSYLSMIENNKEHPSIGLLKRISEKLEVPTSILFFFTITEKDIPKEKREIYKILAPSVKEFILSLFDNETEFFDETTKD